MFAEPTLQDFSAWISWHLDKSAVAAQKAIAKRNVEAAARGAYRSSRTVIASWEIVQEEFDRGIDAALGELKRAIRIDLLDHDDLRRIAEEALRAFAERMKTLVIFDWLPEFKVRLSELDTRLTFALRQFDVGFLEPREPEVPLAMSNSINIGSMSGGAIQQGTKNSVQVLSVEGATKALQDLEGALATASLSEDQLTDIKADIATIKAQLAKPAPSETILVEAARSIRNIAEGIVSGAMTNRVVEAAMALGRSLGLG